MLSEEGGVGTMSDNVRRSRSSRGCLPLADAAGPFGRAVVFRKAIFREAVFREAAFRAAFPTAAFREAFGLALAVRPPARRAWLAVLRPLADRRRAVARAFDRFVAGRRFAR